MQIQKPLIKDNLYYKDLVYRIKDLSGLEIDDDQDTVNRIIEREKTYIDSYNGKSYEAMSEFSKDLYGFFLDVSVKVGIENLIISEMFNYQDVILQGLKRYDSLMSRKEYEKPKMYILK